jgi:hypothetical protein
MASIGPITLDPIQVVVANATVTVRFDVLFSKFDIESGQPYRMTCKVVGEDTLEGNADDPIPNGTLTPVLQIPGLPPFDLGQVIQADGQASKSFSFTKTLAKADLDEDVPPAPNPDEIQAEVTLVPILAATVTRQSNVQTLVA